MKTLVSLGLVLVVHVQPLFADPGAALSPAQLDAVVAGASCFCLPPDPSERFRNRIVDYAASAALDFNSHLSESTFAFGGLRTKDDFIGLSGATN